MVTRRVIKQPLWIESNNLLSEFCWPCLSYWQTRALLSLTVSAGHRVVTRGYQATSVDKNRSTLLNEKDTWNQISRAITTNRQIFSKKFS